MEQAIWVHRGDRWVNVLRTRALNELVPPGGYYVESADTLNWWGPVGKKRANPIIVKWNPLSEAFEFPAGLEGEVEVLDPLPDQTDRTWRMRLDLVARDTIVDYIRTGDLDGLRDRCAEASAAYGLDLQIPEEVLSGVGRNALALGQTQVAVEALTLLIDIDPERAEAHYLLGKAYAQQGDLEKARSCLRRACELGDRRNDHQLPSFREQLERVESLLSKD